MRRPHSKRTIFVVANVDQPPTRRRRWIPFGYVGIAIVEVRNVRWVFQRFAFKSDDLRLDASPTLQIGPLLFRAMLGVVHFDMPEVNEVRVRPKAILVARDRDLLENAHFLLIVECGCHGWSRVRR
jgi:hypothetical protein